MSGRKIKIDNRSKEEKITDFLSAFGGLANITRACKKAKVPRQTIYDWLKADAVFKDAFEEANALALGALEDEAVRRAHEGVLKPVYQQGKKVGSIREYSDTLLIVLLKARAPEKYKERIYQENAGKNGGPIDLSIKDLPEISTDALIRLIDAK